MDDWANVQRQSHELLEQYLVHGMSVLDAGCGFGAMYQHMPAGVCYRGIDISPDLIAIARELFPGGTFEVGDLAAMPQFDDGEFDFVLCAGVELMIRTHLGEDAWQRIAAELTRVGKRVMILEYDKQFTHFFL